MASTEPYRIVLGTSSLWRRAVMDKTGLPYTTAVADIDEDHVVLPGTDLTDRPRSDPTLLSRAIARAKAAAILPKLPTGPTLLVTADQVVSYKGRIREKPKDAAECREFLSSYTDEPATTVSSLVVTNTLTGKQVEGTDIAHQYIEPLPEDVLSALSADKLSLTTSGGLRVESEILKPYLGKRVGDEDSIHGLPLRLMHQLLEEALNGQPLRDAIGL